MIISTSRRQFLIWAGKALEPAKMSQTRMVNGSPRRADTCQGTRGSCKVAKVLNTAAVNGTQLFGARCNVTAN